MKNPVIFALALFAVGTLGAAAADEENALGGAPAEESISVTIVGTLHAGIVAIGGETTGIAVSARGITWELDFAEALTGSSNPETFDGRRVIVKGDLERREGIEGEGGSRWIVHVTDLEAAGPTEGEMVESGLLVRVGRADDRVRVVPTGETTVLDVTSGFGIGSATITRNGPTWPKSVLVRLHLSGLESFRAASEGIAVEWSVSGADDPSRVSLRKGSEETPLAEGSPYFTTARIVGGNGRIPLEDGGCFEVLLPSKLFEANPVEITLHWIDFYRN